MKMCVRLNFFFAVALAVLFGSAFSLRAQQQAEVVDGIAAVVNGQVVTISQLRDLIGGRERAIREAYRGEELQEKVKELRSSALKDLIDRELILQEFKKRKLAIPPYVVDNRVDTVIREEFGGDRAAFIRTLRAQGYSLTQFKEIEHDKIVVQAMRQANVKNNQIVSPTQIEAFYRKNREAYTIPAQVKLRMIVLRDEGDVSGGLDDLPGTEDKKGMAEEIRTKIKEGADFEQMAMMYSEDPTTQELGGDWGWIERGTLNEQLSKEAFSLAKGAVSPVLQLGNSYYILFIEDRQDAKVKPMSEVREEIEQNLIQKKRLEAQDRWLDTLRAKAYIKILT
ncbi:MAG: peptidylprolyl isomerase [Chthoniobacterales bacterium]